MRKETLLRLSDQSKPGVLIEFLHSDGLKHSFYSLVNSLSGDRLTAFDGSPPKINTPLSEVNMTVINIKNKSKEIISWTASKEFAKNKLKK